MHSFHAYIDEAGDEGFKFRAFDDKGSSEWFIVTACVVRATRLSAASRTLRNTLEPIEERRQSPVHFAKLPHEAKVAIIECVAKLPIRIIAICVHKPSLPAGHTLGRERRLHFYAARLLLERISWIARDRAATGEGDGRCHLTFSHCKGLSYSHLKAYFDVIKASKSQVSWPNVDVEGFQVLGHADNIWLRVADAAASGIAQAVELSRHGYWEDRFSRTLKSVVYKNGNNYLSYGMKVMPRIPTPEGERASRYEWLALYR